MAKTDEKLAQEYAEGLVLNNLGHCDKWDKRMQQFDTYDLQAAVENGIQKGRELERKKAQRFAEWLCMNYRFFPWRGWIKSDLSSDKNYTYEELYNSQEFLYYLKQFEK